MTKEEQLFSKRILEYASQCYQREIPVYSDFMNLNEQTIFHSLVKEFPPVRYRLTGGYEPSERKIVCFLPSYWEEDSPPISVIKIMPLNQKFADSLTHRDYLGAVMNLGIERSKVGDIFLGSGGTYLVCAETMAEYLMDQLTSVKRTSVICTLETDPNFQIQVSFEEVEGSIASLRLDNVLSLVYKTSRSKMTPYIEGEKVFVGGRLVTSNSYLLKDGDIISVRGIGKFVYVGVRSQTKKGRYFVTVKKYC